MFPDTDVPMMPVTVVQVPIRRCRTWLSRDPDTEIRRTVRDSTTVE